MTHPVPGRRDVPEGLPAVPRPRHDPDLPECFARSAAALRGVVRRTADVHVWLEARRRAHGPRTERIPLAELDSGWNADPDGGDLGRRGRTPFTVEGLRVNAATDGHGRQWHQPVVRRSEPGVLGILVKDFDGVAHFLLRAAPQPGHRNGLQLAPTVRTTRAELAAARPDSGARHLEHFTGPGRGRVLADTLQSAHGEWSAGAGDRLMLVRAVGEVPAHADFRWLTLGQIGELLRRDHVIDADARSVLACVPHADPDGLALHTDTELLSWFTAERSRHDLSAARVPLADLPGWKRTGHGVTHEEGRHADVVAVAVRTADGPGTTSWTQPMLEPAGTGLRAFLTRRIGGAPHLLVRAAAPGSAGTVEIGPTVDCVPSAHAHLPPGQRPPFLDAVLDAGPSRIRYEAWHSEQGAHFLHAESRHLFVEADEEQAPLQSPPGYRWATPGQLTTLLRHHHPLDVRARTLLSCLTTGAVHL
ncbi:NDP-hexose 2,3-dehydratase family protein [Streptomyces sp. NPDC048507]|uniref:NDP-hexose 2,3-dehydratase family protein n=1 Tax=Streptomyces sp. NPDC048507 TaxID=3365560 RepID=UPI00371DD5EF